LGRVAKAGEKRAPEKKEKTPCQDAGGDYRGRVKRGAEVKGRSTSLDNSAVPDAEAHGLRT